MFGFNSQHLFFCHLIDWIYLDPDRCLASTANIFLLPLERMQRYDYFYFKNKVQIILHLLLNIFQLIKKYHHFVLYIIELIYFNDIYSN